MPQMWLCSFPVIGHEARDVAAKIVSHIDKGDYVDKVEIAGPVL